MEDYMERIDLSIEPGDIVTDVIVVAVTTRLDSFGQAIYVSATDHTGYITQLGALRAALHEVENPAYYDEEYEDE